MNTVAIIGRMLLALVVVLAVMWALARWARKPLTGKADRVMAVLARQQINRNSSVTVLRVMDRALVLGITEQGIRLIAETDLDAVQEVLAVEPAPSRNAGGLLRVRPKPVGKHGALEPAQAAAAPNDFHDVVDANSTLIPALPTAAAAVLDVAPARRGALEGSVLSPNTWKQLVGAARELTVRR